MPPPLRSGAKATRRPRESGCRYAPIFLCSLRSPGGELCGSAALVPACRFATLRCRACTPLLRRVPNNARPRACKCASPPLRWLPGSADAVCRGPPPPPVRPRGPNFPGAPTPRSLLSLSLRSGRAVVATLRFFFCWALVGSAAMAAGSAAAVAFASPFGLGAACPRFPPFLSGKTGAASSCPGGWRFSVGRRA